MLNACVAVCAGTLESVTCTTKLLAPRAVGAPEICPVVDRFKPGGRVPESSDQLYGALPPAAARLWLYAADCVPFGREVVPMDRGKVVPPVVLKTTSTQKFKPL